MICVQVITTTRADYGILRPLLLALEQDAYFSLKLLVSGSHLEDRHGNTVSEIEADGFEISAQIPLGDDGDDAAAVASRMARCIQGFADSYTSDRPDLLVALGDRYEIFAAVAASVPFNIPVAHLHGGELTYGAQDDSFRHAITKMAHLHFSAAETYANRIRQMGEPGDCVFNVGALALDGIKATKRLTKEQLCERFSINWEQAPLLVTLHPETRAEMAPTVFAETVFSALDNVDRTIIITHPNADSGGEAILHAAQTFRDNHPNTYLVPSFGAQGYYSMLDHAAAMIGNSSSGISEALFFDLPVINIGDRQKGRVRSQNIIDVSVTKVEITAGIQKALSVDFKGQIHDAPNPYGDGSASKTITGIFRRIDDLPGLIVKQFQDR